MTTMSNWVEIGWNKKKGGGTHKTKIQNNSERIIFLIPILCATNADPRSSGRVVDKKLARTIPAAESIEVDSKKYNETGKNTGFQTHILFRAANTDNIKEFPKNSYDKGIKVETVEELVLHDKLFTHDLELKCNKGDKVDGNADQVEGKEKEDKEDIRKPVAPETLVGLIMDVVAKQEGLKTEIKALLNKMEILMEAWKSFDQKDHELHRAKLDPSSSTNTPSSSK